MSNKQIKEVLEKSVENQQIYGAGNVLPKLIELKNSRGFSIKSKLANRIQERLNRTKF